mgnify:FL=1|tara:strand:- start:75600 stop:76031 length:432 start_codon:yes stop_codon:yes gene_type:complete
MKYVLSTIALLLISISVIAQNFITVSNSIATDEMVSSPSHQISNFMVEVASENEFKYRNFLREAKNSEKIYEVGQDTFTKKELTKLLRRAAMKTNNLNEFKSFLATKNYSIANELSHQDMHSIFHLFRKNSFEKYLDDLACCI